MRILHCIPTLSGGGAERQLGYLARQQSAAGHEVHVAYLREGPDPGIVRQPGVHCVRLAAWGNRDPAIAFRLARLMRELAPDVVQTWIIQMDILAGSVAALLSIPWILREPCSEEAWPMTLKYRLRLRIGRRAGAIVCNSPGGERYWARYSPDVPRHVIPNAVSLDAIDACERAAAGELGLAPHQPVVLHAGRLCDRQKNVLNVVKAFAACARDSAAVFLLCGEGPDREMLERLVDGQGLSGRIRFLGHVPDVWRWMKRADLFVFASRYEGQPNVVLEAMACACPVILSDIPAHRAIADESTAVFVDAEDSAAISGAIAGCLDDREAGARRARQARQALESRSIEALARQYDRVYGQVTAGRGAR